jgi:hypothetical protein
VEHSDLCPSHQPEVQGRDVRVSNEGFRIPAKHFRIEVGQQSHCAVATSRADNSSNFRPLPHFHEVFGATLILGFLEPPKALDI